MKKVFSRTKGLKPVPFHYCQGCGHSILHRLVAEVIEDMGLLDRAIGVPPAGCAVLAYNYFDVDMGEAPHGRGAAVATGLKRVLPDRLVFTYQGDGDIASIGAAETIHAANRGEKITAVFVNNAVYGMTGGQMAPTSILGQVTTTSPHGRDPSREGFPIQFTELLAQIKGTAFAARVSLHNPAHILKTKKTIRRAFEAQMDNKGFSVVEVLSPCPTNWKMSPLKAMKWVEEVMTTHFPLGVFRDFEGESC